MEPKLLHLLLEPQTLAQVAVVAAMSLMALQAVQA
jgi:hypothetical protein